MPTLLSDLRYALRRLRKAPGFALTAVLTLALGLGATTAIFTLAYQVLLRALPVEHPEQLYKLGKENCGGCVNGGLRDDWNVVSTDLYRYLSKQVPGLAAVQSNTETLSMRRAGENAPAQALDARLVSGSYFGVLGVRAEAGRLLTPADDTEGAAPAAVLSDALWRTKFGADPRLVGGTVLLSGHPYTVVGITAPGFLGERAQADPAGMWLPLAQEPVLDGEQPLNRLPNLSWLNVLARIPSPKGVGPVQAAIVGGLHQWLDQNRGLFTGPSITESTFARQTTELVPAPGGISDLRDRYAQSLKLLLLVAGFVLLVACANLANLLLVRGMARRQELAVRAALGAPRLRLIRQTLLEAVLLALAGGGAALGVAYAGARGMLALVMRGAAVSPLSPAPSAPVLGFALLASVLTGVLFGILPALLGSRSNPVEALRGAGRSTRDASALPQRALVIAQAALSLALLSTAGVLIASLHRLQGQDFGFQTEGRLIITEDLGAAGYKLDELPGVYRQFDSAFARLPGVESFAYATHGPMTNQSWGSIVYQPGLPPRVDEQHAAEFISISPGYFRTIGTPLAAGRDITDGDTAASTHVAVVNRSFAERFFKGRSPLGEHFGPDAKLPAEFTIVGVVEDAKYGAPSAPAPPMYFTPITQTTVFPGTANVVGESSKHYAGSLIFHYHGDEAALAAAVRRTLGAVNGDIPVLKLQSYRVQLGDQFTEQDLLVRLTTLFGALALLLASLGLYGVTAYSVARRTGEIGLRMALGASRGAVLRMVVGGALRQTGWGLLLGLPLAWAGSRLLASTLYQTAAFQPLVLGGVAGLLLLAALAAALLPARRAASIEPTIALRTE